MNSFEKERGSPGGSPYRIEGSAGASPYPDRRKPAEGVHIYLHQPTMVFVTVCTKDRARWLACEEAHRLLAEVWRRAEAWLVGNYVLMPDHLHLFAAPRLGGAPGRATLRRSLGDGKRLGGSLALPDLALPGDALPCITIERWMTYWKSQFSRGHRHADWVWQSSAFHHRLRRDESYAQKWLYVQENPVRAGLAKEIGEWPYQGSIHELRW